MLLNSKLQLNLILKWSPINYSTHPYANGDRVLLQESISRWREEVSSNEIGPYFIYPTIVISSPYPSRFIAAWLYFSTISGPRPAAIKAATSRNYEGKEHHEKFSILSTQS